MKVDAYIGKGQLIDFKAGLEKTMAYCMSLASERDIEKLTDIQNEAYTKVINEICASF